MVSPTQQHAVSHRCSTIPCWLKATHVCFLTTFTSACDKLRGGAAKQQIRIVRVSLAIETWDSQQRGQMAASSDLHVRLNFNGRHHNTAWLHHNGIQTASSNVYGAALVLTQSQLQVLHTCEYVQTYNTSSWEGETRHINSIKQIHHAAECLLQKRHNMKKRCTGCGIAWGCRTLTVLWQQKLLHTLAYWLDAITVHVPAWIWCCLYLLWC